MLHVTTDAMAKKNSKDRVRKWRDRQKKIGGRSLSCWLSLDAARNLDRIKALTGDTNSQAIADALEKQYQSVWYSKMTELKLNIQKQIEQGAKRWDVIRLYHEMIKLLRYDYSSAETVKTALNHLGVPNYNGKTGRWKIDQVRRLMNP
jgi:hypothetical protein